MIPRPSQIKLFPEFTQSWKRSKFQLKPEKYMVFSHWETKKEREQKKAYVKRERRKKN